MAVKRLKLRNSRVTPSSALLTKSAGHKKAAHHFMTAAFLCLVDRLFLIKSTKLDNARVLRLSLCEVKLLLPPWRHELSSLHSFLAGGYVLRIHRIPRLTHAESLYHQSTNAAVKYHGYVHPD